MSDLLDEIKIKVENKANFWKRTLCFIIDFISSTVISFVSTLSIHGFFLGDNNEGFYIGLSISTFALIYFLMCEFIFGKTLGRLITNTIVVNNF